MTRYVGSGLYSAPTFRCKGSLYPPRYTGNREPSLDILRMIWNCPITRGTVNEVEFETIPDEITPPVTRGVGDYGCVLIYLIGITPVTRGIVAVRVSYFVLHGITPVTRGIAAIIQDKEGNYRITPVTRGIAYIT